MSAPASGHTEAFEALGATLRRLADVVDALGRLQGAPAPGPRLVAGAREPEVLVSLDQAALLLGVSRATVERITKGKSCRRRAGRRVLIERAGLLALTRRS